MVNPTLAQARPDLVPLWDPEWNSRGPETVHPNSTLEVRWQCSRGHLWHATVADMAPVAALCPHCAAARVLLEHPGPLQVMADHLTRGGHQVLRNRAHLLPQEPVPIYLPHGKLAIVLNPTGQSGEAHGRHRLYHRDRWQWAQDQGLHLLQVWGEDWDHGPGQVLNTLDTLADPSRLLPPQFQAQEVAKGTAHTFLQRHHPQGPRPCGRAIALTGDHGDPLALLTLTESPRDSGIWRITQYASSQPLPGALGTILAWAEEHLPILHTAATTANGEQLQALCATNGLPRIGLQGPRVRRSPGTPEPIPGQRTWNAGCTDYGRKNPQTITDTPNR